MRPVLIIWLLLALVFDAAAQLPRSTEGQFQYYGEVLTDNTAHAMDRAKSFFNQPFLIHWDTVARSEKPANMVVAGKGYINVRAKLRGLSTPSYVPVALQMSIEIKEGQYRYTINHFEVIDKEGHAQYALEDKPETVKSLVYYQVLQNTHKRVSFVIGWLKKYMKGEE